MSSVQVLIQDDDLSTRSLDELGEDLMVIEAGIGRLELERARRLAEFDRRQGPDRDAMRSATAWLKYRCKMSGARAHRAVMLANRLATLPQVAKAVETGDLSLDQARVLTDLPEHLNDELVSAEVTLVNAIGPLSVADSRRVVDYWRAAVDGPGLADDHAECADRRFLSVSPTTGGMVKIDGLLDPLAGETVRTALAAITPPGGHHDPRTPRQRRADALHDLCRHFLDSGDAPGTEKPHLMVLTDLDALAGRGGGVHETVDGTVLCPAEVEMLSCDCQITRIVFGPEGQPVDVGRASRTIPPHIRRAVIARDRHCQAPGCDISARHCDVHHIKHWADGGATSVENTKLFCRFHHIDEHQPHHPRE